MVDLFSSWIVLSLKSIFRFLIIAILRKRKRGYHVDEVTSSAHIISPKDTSCDVLNIILPFWKTSLILIFLIMCNRWADTFIYGVVQHILIVL